MAASSGSIHSQIRSLVAPMCCLTTLEGAQPLLMKRCVGSDVDKRTVVLVAESLKLILSLVLAAGAQFSIGKLLHDWQGSVRRAGPPAVLFALQNCLLQIAYPRLDSLVFNVVGQTKILFVAGARRLLLGKRISKIQVLSLGMLTGAALASWQSETTSKQSNGYLTSVDRQPKSRCRTSSGEAANLDDVAERHADEQSTEWQVGLLAQIGANALSGLNSTLVESALQGMNPVVFNVELAFYGLLSALLGVCLTITSAPSRLVSGWRLGTVVAPASLAVNGVLTGFVIKAGGGISKAFASVGAILITSLLRAFAEKRPLSRRQGLVAIPLAASGVLLYTKFPHDS